MKINKKNLKKIIFLNYGIKIDTLTPLSGFYDKNYEVVCGGKKYFLKIYGFDKLPAIQFQLDFVAKSLKAGLPVAKIIPTIKSKLLFLFSDTFGIIQEYLPGKQLRSVKMTAARMRQVGELLGMVHKMSYRKKFYGVSWKKYAWDLSQFNIVVRDYVKAKKFLDLNTQSLIEAVFKKWKKSQPGLKKLRKGVCHNDFHNGNILIVGKGKLAITDFGDAMRTWYAGDVAIALAHLCFETKKAQTSSSLINAFLTGYKTQFSLSCTENDSLPLLIQMRAATIIIESQVRLAKENQHELYDKMVITKKYALEYYKV